MLGGAEAGKGLARAGARRWADRELVEEARRVWRRADRGCAGVEEAVE